MNDFIKSVYDGDRFITKQEIKTNGLTSWGAPCTGSFECVIPAGTILVARYDQVPGATGFGCVPEKYEEMEKLLVPAKDRFELKYGGYYFVFLNQDIGTKLELISRADIIKRKIYELKTTVRGWFQEIIVLQALMILFMYIVIIVLLPFKPFVDFYRKKKLEAKRKAEEQGKGR